MSRIVDFARNNHGHVVVRLVCHPFAGGREATLLTERRFNISELALSCLLSTRGDGYDAHHQMSDATYAVALVPGVEIVLDSKRTRKNLLQLGENYGYERPLAGIVPVMRRVISDAEINKLGVKNIVALHKPITAGDKTRRILGVSCSNPGNLLDAFVDEQKEPWGKTELFAFMDNS